MYGQLILLIKLKRIILLFTFITIFINISYAAFPVIDILSFQKDTIQSETPEQYHIRMENMGFDISNCHCKLCGGIDAKKDNIRSNGVNLVILAGISIGIVAIWVAYVFYLVYTCINTGKNCERDPQLTTLSTVYLMGFISLAGIVFLIMGLLKKFKPEWLMKTLPNKKNN